MTPSSCMRKLWWSHRRALLLPLLLAIATIMPAAHAQKAGKAPANGDATIGKTLSDKDCVACHARKFDGNAEMMYLRADRKVHTPEQLAAQIAYCNTELGTNYFPEEEEHIAVYLNLQYYKFKP
jgi:hypothetical protein